MRDGQHLDSLKIRRFRGLSDFDLDGLGSFNVLLGANDAGKTTILEAIFFCQGFQTSNCPTEYKIRKTIMFTGLMR